MNRAGDVVCVCVVERHDCWCFRLVSCRFQAWRHFTRCDRFLNTLERARWPWEQAERPYQLSS